MTSKSNTKGALVAADFPKKAFATLPDKDTISQTELAAASYTWVATESLCLGFCRRLLAGAEIEPGEYGFTPNATDSDVYEPSGFGGLFGDIDRVRDEPEEIISEEGAGNAKRVEAAAANQRDRERGF